MYLCSSNGKGKPYLFESYNLSIIYWRMFVYLCRRTSSWLSLVNESKCLALLVHQWYPAGRKPLRSEPSEDLCNYRAPGSVFKRIEYTVWVNEYIDYERHLQNTHTHNDGHLCCVCARSQKSHACMVSSQGAMCALLDVNISRSVCVCFSFMFRWSF